MLSKGLIPQFLAANRNKVCCEAIFFPKSIFNQELAEPLSAGRIILVVGVTQGVLKMLGPLTVGSMTRSARMGSSSLRAILMAFTGTWDTLTTAGVSGTVSAGISIAIFCGSSSQPPVTKD
jgi:hypothetical protein